MNILMLLTDRFDRGGTQTDIIHLAGSLVARGHAVHVAGAGGDLVADLEATGTQFHAIRSPLGGMVDLVASARDVAGLLRRLTVDVVAPQSLRSTVVAGLLRRLGRLDQPIVTSIHNLHDPGRTGQARWVLRHLADHVTFENAHERRLVGMTSTAAGTPSPIVYSGIDLDRFRPLAASARSGRRAICVARLSEEKNHALLLRAWRRHLDRKPDDELVLVGDGPERPAIEALVDELALSPGVTLLGDRGDIPELLAASDVFVLASSRESYPRSAREALACGVPIVLPDIGGCGEIAVDPSCSSLFPGGDTNALADQFGRWLDATADRQVTATAARRVAEERFRLERWIDTMETLYQEALLAADLSRAEVAA